MNLATQIRPLQRLKVAAGYIRCSTEMQEDSPDQQRKDILAFAKANGYHIIEWFVDFGKSGTTFDERPEFQRMKANVEGRANFEAVICYDESRWGRAIDPEENTFMRVLFRKRGVDVILVKTSVDRSNEFAPMLSAFEGVQASQYSKKLSELTLRGAKNNSIYSNGGTAPYGYRRCAHNTKTDSKRILQNGEWSISGQEKVTWVIGDRYEVSIVRFIFEERAKGKAYVLIAKHLNDKHVPCPARGRWRNSDRKWAGVTVKTILENPAYYGARVYNRNSMSKILARRRGNDPKHLVRYPHWKNDESEWVVTEEAHPAIVTKELWEKANAVNRNQPASAKKGYKYTSQYLLTGLIKCSDCGFNFQGWTGKAKGITYEKYIDSGWQNKRVCSFMGIKKEKLESFALRAIKEVLSDPSLVTKVEERVKALLKVHPQSLANETDALSKALAKNEAAMRNLTRAIETGAKIDLLLTRLEELEAERKALETRLTRLRMEQPRDVNLVDLSTQVAEFVLGFEREFEKAPIEERKLLVRKCISQIIVDRKRNVARVFVRRIPLVTPQLQGLLEIKRVPTEVVGTRSSGGPMFILKKNRPLQVLVIHHGK